MHKYIYSLKEAAVGTESTASGKFNIKTPTTTTSTMVNCHWEILRKSTILGWKYLVTKDQSNTIKCISRVDSRKLLKADSLTCGDFSCPIFGSCSTLVQRETVRSWIDWELCPARRGIHCAKTRVRRVLLLRWMLRLRDQEMNLEWHLRHKQAYVLRHEGAQRAWRHRARNSARRR